MCFSIVHYFSLFHSLHFSWKFLIFLMVWFVLEIFQNYNGYTVTCTLSLFQVLRSATMVKLVFTLTTFWQEWKMMEETSHATYVIDELLY